MLLSMAMMIRSRRRV
ncbi:BnaC01g38420D [Brassica napus]|uniref:BnaC01g38420D protein n=1 Tax=Brassica napus TaxID=3708 RepID=A0A078IKB0_BRANA|nr:BnaC01g38420D [Brassica napus]